MVPSRSSTAATPAGTKHKLSSNSDTKTGSKNQPASSKRSAGGTQKRLRALDSKPAGSILKQSRLTFGPPGSTTSPWLPPSSCFDSAASQNSHASQQNRSGSEQPDSQPVTRLCKRRAQAIDLREVEESVQDHSWDVIDDATSDEEEDDAAQSLKGLSYSKKLGTASLSSMNTPAPARSPFDDIWSLTFPPTTRADLSVHKKKVEEVERWLRDALQGPNQMRKYRRLLCLSGPSGSGKSTVMDILAKQEEIGFDVASFDNRATSGGQGYMQASRAMGERGSTGLTEKFAEFVLYAAGPRRLKLGDDDEPSKQHSSSTETGVVRKSFRFDTAPETLPSSSSNANKVIIIDDLPNLSHLPTKETFQSSLEMLLRKPLTQFDEYGKLLNIPVVVILSESLPRASEESWASGGGDGGGWKERMTSTWDVRTVFGDVIRNHPGFAEIKFNPIPTTLMKSGLKRIVDLALGPGHDSTATGAISPTSNAKTISKKRKAKSKPDSDGDASIGDDMLSTATLLSDAIAKHSDGDIRSAINALQTALRLDAAGAPALATSAVLGSVESDTDLEVVAAKSAKTAREGRSRRLAVGTNQARKRVTSKEKVDQLMTLVAERESSMALWHALGKVLYNKRAGEEKDEMERAMMRDLATRTSRQDLLPEHMLHLERKLSMVDIDALWLQVSVEPSNFLIFLHHNYPQFCEDLDECARIVDQYSFVDARLHPEHESWLSSSLSAYYHFVVSSKATMLHLPSPVPRNRQKLNKPHFWDVGKRSKQFSDGLSDAQAYFQRKASRCMSSAEQQDDAFAYLTLSSSSSTALATEVLPLLAKFRSSEGQWSFPLQMCTSALIFGFPPFLRQRQRSAGKPQLSRRIVLLIANWRAW
ncbi:hypothetical protein K437DRAFT_258362 [Tilletiaria anomala UBC 951]|uniref:AAA+ ATPase domain-containing protein n=1 Tax=Tilletiaria anomala (strain ATCC 24038 / CBS 436.72 / UBC 951) TaxID=1037660 RepID=A0A066VR30_TILAU|nr:uncharacterized protein K437DRAFT_258362 [Tilletiaria anomala UBC 951]KDN41249.1 hypothetical protein K437DRAFT_258362 [Tilletiaria anomala UBC 951]